MPSRQRWGAGPAEDAGQARPQVFPGLLLRTSAGSKLRAWLADCGATQMRGLRRPAPADPRVG